MRIQYIPEHIESLCSFHQAMEGRGYRAAPFMLNGKPSKDPARTHGVVWMRPPESGVIQPIYSDRPQLLGEDEMGVPLLHNLQLTLYLGPPKKNEPTIVCFNIDFYMLGLSHLVDRRIQKQFGIPKDMEIRNAHGQSFTHQYNASWSDRTWSTQIYVLPHEVPGFAAWLPDWIATMEEGRDRHPKAPYPLDGTKIVWYYTWSLAAIQTYRAWEKTMDRGPGERPQAN